MRLISTDGARHRYSVHRLVLENYNPVDGMETLQVNHIDGDKQNNNLNNLEWVTCQENILHAYKNNLHS
uniref:Homing endonuclease n=1 Tax=Siphoviridae sp. ctxMM9 TaxID=2827973 RepID=A0A8S5T646_9CAUD|nr:MAG TPA: homing endonuclease [Siphoviridae sp. ctxMM9]